MNEQAVGERSMRPVNKIALALVAVASVLSVLQFAFSAVAAEPALVVAPPAVAWLVRLVHLATEAALVAVLLRNAPVIDAGRRSRKVLRLLVVVAMGAYMVYGVLFDLAGPPVEEIWRGPAGGFPWWFDAMNVVGLVGLVGPWVLGITMLVQGDRSTAARLLAVAAPVAVVTHLLPAVLGASWAGLPLAGVLTSFGLALLGARGLTDGRDRPSSRAPSRTGSAARRPRTSSRPPGRPR
ncbi:hypothetical protein [Kocuria sabuli]|uniref:hypothetical protein n=1 Tax=Kocuria sabuli TaxID=3071448 RepID=UPI0034D6B8B0